MLTRIFRKGMLFLIVVCVHNGYAQKFYLETGFSTAYFKNYTNNLGKNTLDLNYSKPQKPFVEAGFRLKLYNNVRESFERIQWDIATQYSNYQINTAFSSGNIKIPTQYDLNYISLKTGINVTAINWRKLQLQIHSHFSYDWLTFGTNKYENKVIDLYKDNTFDRTLLRFHRGALIQYEITDQITTYLNYNVADSFKEKNKDSNNGENYVFKTNAISFGLLFRIDEFN